MHLLQNFAFIIGRVCISAIFILSGLSKIVDWQNAKEGFALTLSYWITQLNSSPMMLKMVESMSQMLIPVLIIGIIFELLGGLLIFLGLKVRFGALLLLLLLIPTTFLFHHFWLLEGADQALQRVMFLKNVAIIGGLFILLVCDKNCKTTKQKEKKS